MNMRTRFNMTTYITVAVMLIWAVSAVVGFMRIRGAIDTMVRADRLVDSLYQLRILSLEYETGPSVRKVRQWELLQGNIEKNIRQLPNAPQEVHDSIVTMKELFAKITSLQTTDSPHIARLMKQLFASLDIESQRVIDWAHALADVSRASFLRDFRLYGIVTMAVLFLVALITTGVLQMTRCTIMKSIVTFKNRAAEIARGEFGAEIEVPGADELSDLALTFNVMSRELSKTYDDLYQQATLLEGEVAERQRAQEGLQENENRLKALVDILQQDFATLEELAAYTIKDAVELTRSSIGFLFQYDEQEALFTISAWSPERIEGCTAGMDQQVRLDQAGYWAEAVRQRRAIVVNDFDAPSDLKRGLPGGHIKVTRFISLPVLQAGSIVAVVGVGNKDVDYDQTDLLQLTLLMDSVWKIAERIRMRSLQASLQDRLNHSQRLEAVGRLAGGVAHDFNNKLLVIMGFTDMLLSQDGLPPGMRDFLSHIMKAAEHSRDITRQLLTFSRNQVIDPKLLNLNHIVSDLEKTMGRLIGEDIILRTTLAKDLWTVRLDPVQVDQIIMNLAVNARDAMPGGGLLTIETRNATIGEHDEATFPEAPPDDYVLLTVSDTGCGMEKELLDHIFEPFFTTKGEGKGTGLGLATIYGIVSQNRGIVKVYSEPGKGSSFTVCFPRHRDDEEAVAETATAETFRGSGTVLLVEDEEEVRLLEQGLLELIGFTVVAASSGEEALGIWRSRQDIDLVMTDVVMPGMSGREMVQVIAGERQGIRTLFLSGYPLDHLGKGKMLDEGIQFLQKPFSLDSLRRKLGEVMSA